MRVAPHEVFIPSTATENGLYENALKALAIGICVLDGMRELKIELIAFTH